MKQRPYEAALNKVMLGFLSNFTCVLNVFSRVLPEICRSNKQHLFGWLQQLRLTPWWCDCRWKMASCCRPYSLLCPSSTSMERLGWSSTSLSLTSFEISWWSGSPPLQRARKRTGVSWVVLIFESYFLKDFRCYCVFFSVPLRTDTGSLKSCWRRAFLLSKCRPFSQ